MFITTFGDCHLTSNNKQQWYKMKNLFAKIIRYSPFWLIALAMLVAAYHIAYYW